jgi:Uma2 family endonuclease
MPYIPWSSLTKVSECKAPFIIQSLSARHVPEYWITDPTSGKVTVLEWIEGLYEQQVYQGSKKIDSPLFPTLELTAARILSAGC